MGKVEPQLGDFGLVRTPDLGGRIIRIGTDSWMNHAFIYVGDGQIIEARPGGAGLNTVEAYSNRKFHLAWSTDLIQLTDKQRADIVRWSYAQQGIGYNWLDIAAISADVIWGIDPPKWAVKIIEDDNRLICSQLVDKAYHLSDVELFNDNRLSGSVTPGDLWNVLLAAGY